MLKIVDVWVKSEFVQDYIKLTEIKMLSARTETDVLLFNIFQDKNDCTHFVHYEEYRNQQAEFDHKQTQHYKVWKNSVENMMLKPRSHTSLSKVYQ